MKILKSNAFYILSISIMFGAMRANESFLDRLTAATQNYSSQNSGALMPLSDIYDYIVDNKYDAQGKEILLESRIKNIIMTSLDSTIRDEYQSKMPLEEILKYITQKCRDILETERVFKEIRLVSAAESSPEIMQSEAEIMRFQRVQNFLKASEDRQETYKEEDWRNVPIGLNRPELQGNESDSGYASDKEDSVKADDEDVEIIESFQNADRQLTISDRGMAFDEESKAKRMDVIRAEGKGNIQILQGSAINWFKINFPIFNTTDLIKIYHILYALANCDDTLPALINTLNNCLATAFGKQRKESGRWLMNQLIGNRAEELLINGNLNWKDKLRIELLKRYFYKEEHELEGSENDPFTLDELIRFRNEATAIETMRIKPASSAEKKILASSLILLGGFAAYDIARLNNPNLFDPAVDFVTKTLPSAALLSNLQNVGQSALSSVWSNMPSLSLGGAINGMSGLFNR